MPAYKFGAIPFLTEAPFNLNESRRGDCAMNLIARLTMKSILVGYRFFGCMSHVMWLTLWHTLSVKLSVFIHGDSFDPINEGFKVKEQHSAHNVNRFMFQYYL